MIGIGQNQIVVILLLRRRKIGLAKRRIFEVAEKFFEEVKA